MCFKTPSYGGVLKLSTKLYSMRMSDCRSECQSFCDMKASLERKFSTHWAEEEQREIMMRGQYLEKLLRLNASGVLTDEDYEFFER